MCIPFPESCVFLYDVFLYLSFKIFNGKDFFFHFLQVMYCWCTFSAFSYLGTSLFLKFCRTVLLKVFVPSGLGLYNPTPHLSVEFLFKNSLVILQEQRTNDTSLDFLHSRFSSFLWLSKLWLHCVLLWVSLSKLKFSELQFLIFFHTLDNFSVFFMYFYSTICFFCSFCWYSYFPDYT